MAFILLAETGNETLIGKLCRMYIFVFDGILW